MGNDVTSSDSRKQKEEERRSSALSSRELVLPLPRKSLETPEGCLRGVVGQAS